MSRIGNSIERGLQSLNAGLDSPTLQWSGQSYTIVPNRTELDKTLEAGGETSTANVRFILLLSELGDTFPASNEFVTVDEVDYQIQKTQVSACKSYLALDCLDPNRGA